MSARAVISEVHTVPDEDICQSFQFHNYEKQTRLTNDLGQMIDNMGTSIEIFTLR